MLFVDDFTGVSDSEEQLQTIIDGVHACCFKWRLMANVSNSVSKSSDGLCCRRWLEVER